MALKTYEIRFQCKIYIVSSLIWGRITIYINFLCIFTQLKLFTMLKGSKRKAMTEYWLISAPGEKTCQQTWETMNNVTNKQNNLCANYKFHIPDLKVIIIYVN